MSHIAYGKIREMKRLERNTQIDAFRPGPPNFAVFSKRKRRGSVRRINLTPTMYSRGWPIDYASWPGESYEILAPSRS